MIQWKVTEAEADYIFKALALRPWGEVNPLIQNLLKQANPPTDPNQVQLKPGADTFPE